MSAPVRPSVIESITQRTEKESGSNSREAVSGFDELLEFHLTEEEEPETPIPPVEKSAPKTEEPWTIHGALAALPVVDVPPVVLLAASSQREDLENLPKETAKLSPPLPPPSLPTTIEPVSLERTEQIARVPLQDLPLIRPEKKLPPPLIEKPEEIAEKLSANALIGRGTQDAQQARMLLVMDKFEEKSSPELHELFSPSPSPSPELQSALPLVRIKSVAPNDSTLGVNSDPSLTAVTPAPVGIFEEAAESELTIHQRPVPALAAIREQIHIFRGTPENELKVVVRPDSETEIFLHVTREDGQIRLQARCERGNFDWLDSQWNTIQSSLRAQGIHVEPLQSTSASQSSSQFSSSHHPQDSHSRREQPRTSDNPMVEQNFLQSRKSSQRPAATSVQVLGWQSWA